MKFNFYFHSKSPIFLASQLGYHEIVQLLLTKADIDINAHSIIILIFLM